MTKIRLNKTHRDILTAYGQGKIADLIDRKKEKALYAALIEGTNKAIRVKYPEEHMAVLRLYKLARFDRCVKYQFPSGRVDGFTFQYEDEKLLADLPSRSGCFDSAVYPVDKKFKAAYDDYAKVKKVNDEERAKKNANLYSLIESAKTLDDVMDVIDLPKEILERLGRKSTALVALSSDTLKSLKRDFAIKAA